MKKCTILCQLSGVSQALQLEGVVEHSRVWAKNKQFTFEGVERLPDGTLPKNTNMDYNEALNLVISQIQENKESTCAPQGELVLFSTEDGYGFFHISTGAVVVEPVWRLASNFTNGYAAVKSHKNKVGLIDTKGEVHCPVIYDEESFDHFAAGASGNLLVAWKDELRGVITLNNETIIPFGLHSQFLVSFNELLTFTKYRQETGAVEGKTKATNAHYYTNEGKLIIKSIDAQYVSFGNYRLISKAGKFGIINIKEGEIVLHPQLSKRDGYAVMHELEKIKE